MNSYLDVAHLDVQESITIAVKMSNLKVTSHVMFISCLENSYHTFVGLRCASKV